MLPRFKIQYPMKNRDKDIMHYFIMQRQNTRFFYVVLRSA